MQHSKSDKTKSDKKTNQNNSEDIDIDKLDPKMRKARSELVSGRMDIYKIVGVSSNASQSLIRKKCTEKLAKYHPNKIHVLLNKVPIEQRDKEEKKLHTYYNLIHQAYEILKDPHKRENYDFQKKVADNSDFYNQRDSFNDFIQLQEANITDESRKKAQNDFELNTIEFDRKRGFNREQLKEDPLSKDDMKKRLDDLTMEREQQNIEYTPVNMFENKTYSQVEFNKIWERYQKQKGQNTTNMNDRSVIEWNGISAANDFGNTNDNYVSIDSNYEDPFSDNYNTGEYGKNETHDDDFNMNDINADFDDTDINVDYVNEHNKHNDDIMSKFEELQNQYNKEQKEYENRTFTSDTDWKSVMENPMNISTQLGMYVGDKLNPYDTGSKMTIDKNLVEVYGELLNE